VRTYSLRDLDLGFVKLDDEAKRILTERAVPILAAVARRLIAEEQSRLAEPRKGVMTDQPDSSA
jgi:hypothetical protein